MKPRRRKRVPKDEVGLYQKTFRNKAKEVVELPGWWLRYSFKGEQLRIPLHTRDKAEAIEVAKRQRGLPPKAKEGDPEFGWTKAIEKYLTEKQQDERPPGFHGKTWRTFRPGTVGKVRSCLVKFANWTKTKSPQQVTKKHLEDYRDLYAKNSKASARTTLAQVLAFFEHIGVFPGRIQLPEKKKLERREVVVAINRSNDLISNAPNDRLRYVLFCGFHAGLRRGEIMHSTPTWFHLDREILRVPRVDEVAANVFEVKDSETRDIPLSEDFLAFVKDFLRDKKRNEYCLQNPTKRRSKTGTYDFRRPFTEYASETGIPELFPHAMRHSWITEICNSGNHSVQEVAAWSGDSIDTIEKHYWHRKATPGALHHTMKGVRKGDADRALQTDVAEILALMRSGKQKEAEERLRDLVPDESRFFSTLAAIPGYEPKRNAKGQIVG